MYTYPYTNGCHGCGGRGWVSPGYGTATVCPVCGGSGISRVAQPKPPTTTPYTQPYISAPNIPSIPMGKCPNAASGSCFCTGACRSEPQSFVDWYKQFKEDLHKDDDNNER